MKKLIPLLLWTLSASALTSREIVFTNKCPFGVNIAFSSWVSSLGMVGDKIGRGSYWATEGWLPLAPGGSHTVRVSKHDKAAVLVQSKNGKVLTGSDQSFCVSGAPFSSQLFMKNGQRIWFVVGTNDRNAQGKTCEETGGHMRNFENLYFGESAKRNFNIVWCD